MADLTLLPGSLDLFYLLVNGVAGGVFLSLLLWGFVLLVTGIMGRLSMQSLVVILVTYFVAVLVGYVGALVAVPLFIFSLIFMTIEILNFLGRAR